MSDDRYLNLGRSAATEIPATFVAARLMDNPRLGRRTFIVGTREMGLLLIVVIIITIVIVIVTTTIIISSSPASTSLLLPSPGAQLTLCIALITAYASPSHAIGASLVGKFAATGAFNLV